MGRASPMHHEIGTRAPRRARHNVVDKSAWLSEVLAWRPPVLASLRRRSLTIRMRGSHSPCKHSELLAVATALGTPPYGFGLEASERTRS